MAEEVQQESKKSIKNTKKEYVAAVGRRKEAVARARIYKTVKPDLKWGEYSIKKGEILVNGVTIAEYFPAEEARKRYTEPLRITNAHQQNYAITIRVTGGGRAGQLDAVIAAISNALNNLDREKYRPSLKKKGFLTRDPRVRQRRKVGMGGKSRRKKQSPKR
jgi:small subunit ribosomal protein S9